jgi:hypothetical protein
MLMLMWCTQTVHHISLFRCQCARGRLTATGSNFLGQARNRRLRHWADVVDPAPAENVAARLVRLNWHIAPPKAQPLIMKQSVSIDIIDD